jgi:hypothetical protein
VVLIREKKQAVSVALWIGILFTMLCMCLLIGSRPAAAAGSIELQTEAGYDGKVKEGQWFPVKFTVTNPTEDISGDLVVQITSPTGGNDTTYVKHLDLPKQTKKVVWMSLPGMSYSNINNVVKFYKGDISKGELVPISKGNDYIVTSSNQAIQVGVLARDPDTFNFLSLLQSKNIPISVTRLDPDQLPGESIMLDGLDVIALNDFASDQLKEDQVKAITSWVSRGGTLVLAGGAGYPKTAKAFESLSPVAYTGTTSLSRLASLEKASGKELKLAAPLTVSTSSLKAGEVVYQDEQQPLFAKRQVDSGDVWYVAYDVALNPMASWNGNPEIWDKVVQNHSVGMMNGNGRMNYSFMHQFMEMQYALDLFPSLVPPSFFTLLIVFLIYVIIVAPLLYFLLKRLDKREWAWIIIPVFSILSSMVIFMIGSSDKSSTLTHTLNTLELSGNGQAQRTSATAVFVPRGGQYEIEVPKSAHTFTSYTNQGGGNNGRLTGVSDQFIHLDNEKTRIGWTDVPYWSVRKAWIQNAESEPLGKFDVNLTIDSAGLKGEITNATKTDLTDVDFLINRKVFKVGELKAGEKKTLGLTAPFNLNAGHYDYGSLLFTNNNGMNMNGNGDPYQRERQMINAYMNRKNNGTDRGKPLVIGWSKDKQTVYKVNGKESSSDQLNLWVQEVDFQVVQGDNISIPYGYLSPVIVNNSASQMMLEPNGSMMIGNGSVTFEYALPAIPNAAYTNLKMSLAGGGLPQSVTMELWNEEKQAWEPLDLRSTIEKTDNLQAYIFGGGTAIRMKATTTQQVSFQNPEVALEGTVRP